MSLKSHIYDNFRIGSPVLLILFFASCVHCNTTSTCGQNAIFNTYLDLAIDMIVKAKQNIPTSSECHTLKVECAASFQMGQKSRDPESTLKPIINTSHTLKAVDCADIFQMGHKTSGIYEIWPLNRITGDKSVNVYCDMHTDGGGWTVIQRRGDHFQSPTDYFYRDWRSYKKGFGDVEKDFWLGNDNIFVLTNQKLYSVIFDLKEEGPRHIKEYAFYDQFWIDDEDRQYTLHISNYSGNAGDSMADHNNHSFSTKDRDNDRNSTINCAQRYKGAWWYHDCISSNLNGVYEKGKFEKFIVGVSGDWYHWKKSLEPLDWCEIKIRPRNFNPSSHQ